MLEAAVAQKKLPVFYGYVIAFEARVKAGLQDCDVDPVKNLCHGGAKFIRDNRQHILDRYAHQAENIAKYLGKDGKCMFLIEPDFWQYYGDSSQEGGANSGEYMRALYDDICKVVREKLPNAIFSWDISAWLKPDAMEKWWSYFKTSPYISYIHTSGGQSRPDLANIKENELTWKFMNQLTGKKIIADCGYGVAGGASNNCAGWQSEKNHSDRMADGCISLSQGSNPFNPTLKPKVC